MERIRIARFAEPYAASLSADFLQRQGFDADFTEVSGKGPSIACVLVARHQAGAAYDLLRRVSCGDFEHGMPEADPELSDLAIELSLAIRGTAMAAATPGWLNVLPILLIAAFLLLSVFLQMVSPLARNFVAIHMGW